ncbi:hypothetical protein SUGI_1115540 [Cryptomeria japonica]|nr:hypothetical protein SUGI_1115540 [Cryptomeria japonica]
MEMAKQGYREAKNRGDNEEEARWANQIGHLLKERGEYVEALRWFQIDYELSLKHLPQKQLMPTCQSIGEMYLRLERFDDALIYQKKHLEFAQKVDDLVEQQRASTQLGRTYFDIYEKNEDNYFALKKAKKYVKLSLELARTLKENPPNRNSPSFVKELVDAYNNMGLLKIYLEDYIEAERVLQDGLRICDNEEVADNDEGRTRLHHNLGRIYIEIKEWEKAKEHIHIDIQICQNIPHPQGEANGLINLGLIHYKLHKYDDALLCYKRALRIASKLEDEDALVKSVRLNIESTEEALKIMSELVQEEQQLKKLTRNASLALGTVSQRRNQIQLHKFLKRLIEIAINIEAWPKYLEYAKKAKNVVKGLRDMEKLSDAFLDIGEAYYNLRKFDKAKKWYMKSWKASKAIHNLEGQAVAKINIGNALDSAGEWTEALEAYQEGYDMAVQGKVISSQSTALQNMHYSYMLRFDNLEEARKLEPDIERLKEIIAKKGDDKGSDDERLSETESESDDSVNVADEEMTTHHSPIRLFERTADSGHLFGHDAGNTSGQGAKPHALVEDDLPLSQYLNSCKKGFKKEKVPQDMQGKKRSQNSSSLEANNKSQEKNDNALLPQVVASELLVGCKRSHMVISDDESSDNPKKSHINLHMEKDKDPKTCILEIRDNMSAYSSERIPSKARGTHVSPHVLGQISADGNSGNSKGVTEISTSVQKGVDFSTGLVPTRSLDSLISVRIGEIIVTVDVGGPCQYDLKTIGWLKLEVVQQYCVQVYSKDKSLGLKPVVQELIYKGSTHKSDELVKDLISSLIPGDIIDAVINGWVWLTLADQYLISCKECSQTPNQILLTKLYNMKVSEDEVVVSNCELDDVSVLPLIKALGKSGIFSLLDLSHNSLGNQTLHSVQEMIAASNNRNLGLTLDLHDNQLGASALLQICQCPVSLSRLEVLNLAGNRLTDASARHLATIIEDCKALAILNLEGCSLTSRTVHRISSALPLESGLVKLSIGKNHIYGNCISDLLKKLSKLESFSDLDLTNVELNKTSIDSLCHLLQTSSSIASLVIQGTNIGKDGALKLSETLAERAMAVTVLDMSFCGIGLHGGEKLFNDLSLHEGLLQLNLSGNPLEERGVNALGHLLGNAQCHLKWLMVNKCSLGQPGVLKIIKALSENRSLQELGLAENTIVGDDTIFNIVGGADRTSTACCGEEVVTNKNNHGEYSEIRTRDKSIQIEIPIVMECVEFLDRANDERHSPVGRMYHSIPTEFNYNGAKACTGDKIVSIEQHSQQTYKKHDRNHNKYDVADSEDEGRPEGVNCSSLEEDCASSSRSLGLVRGRSHQFQDFQSIISPPPKGETKANGIPLTEYASELSSAICLARYLQLLDLSDNLLTSEIVEQLYVAWSSNTRAGTPVKHSDNQIVHFTVEGRQCCGLRKCCQRSC